MKATPENTNSLRALVRGREDIQKLRMENGGRIVSNCYAKMGVAPGTKVNPEDKESKNILKQATKEYKLLTEGLTKKTIQAQLKALQEKKGTLELITSIADSTMIDSWIKLKKLEVSILKVIELELEAFDIYNHY